MHSNSCWALLYKIQDFIENGTIAIAPPSTQNNGTNPLPSQAAKPSTSSVNKVPTEELLINPSQLIAPLGSTVRVRIMKSNVPLIAQVNIPGLIHLS